jgi:penicillin-binding protein 1B
MSPWGKAFMLFLIVCGTLGVGTFTYFYVKYSRLTDQKIKEGPFSGMSLLYAAPRPINVGDDARATEIATYLRRCQYTESNTSRAGWYKVRPDGIEINPGPDAYDQEGAVIKIEGGKVSQIISLADHADRTQYLLEPELITNISDRKEREKRRYVRYDDIPQVMIDAVLSAEDKHFFSHPGVDPIGIIRAAVVDLKDRKASQGASTLTMQVAGTLWLNRADRTWHRKLPELFITLHLERTLTKKQIFEYYANAIYLGNQGSFSINGFGEAAHAYFGKDLKQVTTGEAALLAGLAQNSSMWDPYRHPESAAKRRNIVLNLMRENGKITQQEYDEASTVPVKVTRGTIDTSDAPFFVDLVNEQLQDQFHDADFHTGGDRVYTTLDMDLQRDAVEAVKVGIQETDQQWKRRSKKYGTDEFPVAQVCMVVLDTQTGELKALVGGRSYGVSQLDRCLAKRQPASSFKPFVYVTAMATGVENNGGPVLTPATTVVDEETTFYNGDQPPWTPADFKNEYRNAPVTLREALAHSMNVPAVKVAEMVGYDKVAATARAVGLNGDIKPTPAIALGSYVVTPLEIASAYTVFPNGGQLLQSSFIKSVRDRDSHTIFQSQLQRHQAIDPRAAFLVENMMEEVIRSGTAASVRSKGFTLPAAGKTGTERDGWFAGFTSRLICIVWVGFDDYRDFKLEGAHSALPIWVEFMKRAHQHREYRNVHTFDPPDGIVTVEIDSDTGERATRACPNVRDEYFIAGTEPVQVCHIHGNGRTQVASWEPTQPPTGEPPTEGGSVVAARRPSEPKPARSIPVTPAQPGQQQPAAKKGFLGWLGGLFK